jgi:hypothetical protein
MTARKSMHAARKRRSAEAWNWQTPQGKPLCLEGGKVHMLATGKPPEYDHIWQLALGGTDDDENIQPLDPADHKVKTRADAGARGMIRRITGQNKPKRKSYWPTGRKMQSRGFEKREREKVDG